MRIGMIAMSAMGSLHNQELHRAGLDLTSLRERWNVIASLPSLALLTLAGMTPKQHHVTYFDVEDMRGIDSLPQDFDLVAISSYTANILQAYELAGRYKALGIPVVIGGPHAGSLPEEAARYCDAVVIGAGELSWPAILRDCEAGNLQPFYGSLETGYRASFHLKDAYMPAFELLDVSKYKRLLVETSRGCPHHCEFCASSVLLTGGYKQKPAEKVLAEIDRIKSIWSRPFIEFADDNTFVNLKYWRALLPELAKRKVRWFAQTDVSVAKDGELLQLMRNSGCAQLLLGLEGVSEKDLEGVDLRRNWKRDQYASYRDAIRTIQSHGITVNGCFIAGLDTQDAEVFDNIFNFVEETELYEVQVTILTPFPGTPLYRRLKQEGRILRDGDGAWDRYTLYDVNYVPKLMSPDELTQGFRGLFQRLYSDDFTRFRREAFKKHLRATRTAPAMTM